jgi:2-methylisocitrate lyase-like PEP mutase family enzyme
MPEQDKAERLRALHHAPPILVLPNAWDAASARVFEAAGFPAIATTSAGVAASLGYADGGIVPAHEMIEAVARIARAVSVPVTADIEHGYAASADAVAETVLRVIAAGAVGVNLEDWVPGASALEPLDLQCEKIRAVVRAAATAGVRVVVNARTDVFLRKVGSANDMLAMAAARGRAFKDAGADCVFVPGIVDKAIIGSLVSAIGAPINVLATAGLPPVKELEAIGVARVSIGSGAMRATMAVVQEIARELRTSGTYTSFIDRAMPYDAANELMRR